MDGKRKLSKPVWCLDLVIERQCVTNVESVWKILLHKLVVMKYKPVRTTFSETFVTMSTKFESTTSNVKISIVLQIKP